MAGLMISIGGAAYLFCLSKGIMVVGAFMFAAGLFTICEYQYNLYTGKVGYIAASFTNTALIKLTILSLAFNLIASFLAGVLLQSLYPALRESALTLYTAKLASSYVKSFISAIFCGILVFYAVDTFKRGIKIGVFIFIPLFIVCGFDHSIANSFYNGAAISSLTWSVRNVIFTLIVIIGNGIGGMLPLLFTRKYKKNSKEN